MKELKATVIKTGNSLALVIPSAFVRRLGIRPKDRVIVNAKPQIGKISYTFTQIRQLPLV